MIREAGVADIPAMMHVMHKAFDPAHGEAWSAPQCASALSIPGTTMLVSQSDGAINGFALVRTMFDEAELLLIAVSPAEQNGGLGSALLEAVVECAQVSGVAKLHLEMRANNSALDFYSRRGFVNVGRRRDYYRGLDGRLTDALTMSRDLRVAGETLES